MACLVKLYHYQLRIFEFILKRDLQPDYQEKCCHMKEVLSDNDESKKEMFVFVEEVPLSQAQSRGVIDQQNFLCAQY